MTITDPDAADASWLPIADARRTMLDAVRPVTGWESIPLSDALGRVLDRDVVAPFDVPAHDNCAMDGYALRAADLAPAGGTRLTVVGTALAGKAFSGSVGAGQAVRVMTGAVLPPGADLVVPQESTHAEGDTVEFPAGARVGQNVRRAGEDLARGQAALRAGRRIGPADLGLLASLGIAEVAVRRRIRVAIVSTGDEIASIGRALGPGEIYDSNRYTLTAALRRLDVELLDLGVVRDDPVALDHAFRNAAEAADAVITSGGVSVGEADFVKQLMTRLGAVHFWKIAIKPGRPMAFGPGADRRRPACVAPIRKGKGRTEFLRALLFDDGDGWKVKPGAQQGSGVLRSIAEANCFIVLPEDQGNVAAGEAVQVQLFDGLL